MGNVLYISNYKRRKISSTQLGDLIYKYRMSLSDIDVIIKDVNTHRSFLKKIFLLIWGLLSAVALVLFFTRCGMYALLSVMPIIGILIIPIIIESSSLIKRKKHLEAASKVSDRLRSRIEEVYPEYFLVPGNE